MDILKPSVVWVGGRCYRKNNQGKSFHGEENSSALQNLALSKRGFSVILVILLDVSANIENQVHLLYIQVQMCSLYYMFRYRCVHYIICSDIDVNSLYYMFRYRCVHYMSGGKCNYDLCGDCFSAANKEQSQLQFLIIFL